MIEGITNKRIEIIEEGLYNLMVENRELDKRLEKLEGKNGIKT